MFCEALGPRGGVSPLSEPSAGKPGHLLAVLMQSGHVAPLTKAISPFLFLGTPFVQCLYSGLSFSSSSTEGGCRRSDSCKRCRRPPCDLCRPKQRVAT